MSMGTQNGGASSSTRLQPQLMSTSLGLTLTPVLGTASDVRGMLANVMTGFKDLQQDMTKMINRVAERAQQGHERLTDELADPKSHARSGQAHVIQNTDQCLAESLALAAKESEARDSRMPREIERLLNDHDSTYAQTMTNLEKRLDAKADLMMRKLDELFSSNNQENDFGPSGNSRQAIDGSE